MLEEELLSESTKPVLFLEDSGRRVSVPVGTILLEALEMAGLPIRSDCGGRGSCGKCRILVSPSDSLTSPTDCEMELLEKEEMDQGVRLACQCKVLANVAVKTVEEPAEERLPSAKTTLAGFYQSDPAVRRVILEAEDSQGEPRERDILGFVMRRIAKAGLLPPPLWDIEALRELSEPDILEGHITSVWHKKRGITSLKRGACHRSLGLALDIGTTTIAGYLCNMDKGEIISSASITNPQSRFGEDVISRIAYASSNPRGSKILHEKAIKGVNLVIGKCLEMAQCHREEVDEVLAVGNTTMLELFAGMNPHALGRAPYLPLCLCPLDVRAGDLGLEVSPGTNVHIFPVISGFVGGDALAATLSQGLHQAEEPTLLVDIGTNGELVLGSKDFLLATSCATGPALEGAHLSCGMRATKGAIWKVWERGGRLEWEVLGPEGEVPRGICGSGVIDALASLITIGVLLPNGRFLEGGPGVLLDDSGIGRAFELVKKGEEGAKRSLFITLKDIRQVQLAKAALYVGIKFLMKKAGLNEVPRLILTGAFGARFNWRSAVRIGMIPKEAATGQVLVVDNAAGLGAVMALLDSGKRELARSLTQKVEVVELAQEPDFSQAFFEALEFPPPSPGEASALEARR